MNLLVMRNSWTNIAVGQRVQLFDENDAGNIVSYFGIVETFIEPGYLGVEVKWSPNLTSWHNADTLWDASDDQFRAFEKVMPRLESIVSEKLPVGSTLEELWTAHNRIYKKIKALIDYINEMPR